MVNKISKHEGFGLALKTKPVARTTHCLLHHHADSLPVRVGVLVPKRFVKRAVDRNLVKRVAREALRVSTQLPHTGQVLVRVNKGFKPDNFPSKAQWWIEIRQLLNALSPN